MKKIQVLFFALLICLFAANLYAQEQGKISGKILSTLNIPIEGAVISVTGSEDVTTDKNGVFQIQCKDPQKANISVWAAGYYTVFQAVNNRKEMSIILIPESEYKYNETTVLPFRIETNGVTTSAENIAKKDFVPAGMKIDRALAGQIAGLQVTRGSGMPGEGSYLNFRGVRSFVGNNAPLVVINGIPHIPDVNKWRVENGELRVNNSNDSVADSQLSTLNSPFNLVYFDAFAPEKQPEMWSQELFNRLYVLLDRDGILTTYCAKGVVRRMLQTAGFTVERLPGPPGGKREILRARKQE